MRGCLVNPMSGFTTNQFNHHIPELQNCHVQEMGFWMWRVAAVRLTIGITLTPPEDDESDPEVMTADGVFGCPLNGISGPFRTEAQQVVHRVGFRNSIDGMNSEFDPSHPAQSWNAQFCEGCPHNTAFPGETGWALTGSFRASFSAGSFSTERGTSIIQSGMALTIFGGDPVLGGTYFHQVPIWTISLVEDWTVSGSVVIQPILYYEWRDQFGMPLFDAFTGTMF